MIRVTNRALSYDSEPRFLNAYTPKVGFGHISGGIRVYVYSFLGYIFEVNEDTIHLLHKPEYVERLISNYLSASGV